MGSIPLSAEADSPLLRYYGDIYGNADGGGTNDTGTIFRLAPDGTVITLYNFSALSNVRVGTNSDGAYPFGSLLFGSDCSLYGTTLAGGLGSYGTTFQLTVAPHWEASNIAAVPDGTARILWIRTDGAAGVWALNASDTQTAVGPTYGPYPGWVAQRITAASDGTSHILWSRSDDAVGIWTLSQTGVQTSVGPTYGPFTGWKAVDLTAATDGTSRVLWTNANGAAGIWSFGANGTETAIGPTYGPFPGWTAEGIGMAGDGTARILWTRSDGAMGLWTMDANNRSVIVGSVYGPYSDSQGTWSATGLTTLADGSSQVLWKRSDGAVGLWTFDESGAAVTTGTVYGPYPGFTATALKSGSEQSRMLWVRSDGAAGLWNFESNDQASMVGPVYGPF